MKIKKEKKQINQLKCNDITVIERVKSKGRALLLLQ